jgi:hypothetical protein
MNATPLPPKPFFSKYSVLPGQVRALPPCNCLRIFSISGSLTLAFNFGDPVPCAAGDTFKADFPGVFETVHAEAGGGEAVIIFGRGNTASKITGGSIGGSAIIITSSPEGSVIASPGALAYNTTDGGYWVKATGVGNTGWVQLIA